jgi:Sulfotransferase family
MDDRSLQSIDHIDVPLATANNHLRALAPLVDENWATWTETSADKLTARTKVAVVSSDRDPSSTTSITSTPTKEKNNDRDEKDDPCSRIKNQISKHGIDDPPERRLEFLHIPDTGSSAIECLGAENGRAWGASHWKKTCGCYGRGIHCEPSQRSNETKSPQTPELLNHANWHLPMSYTMDMDYTPYYQRRDSNLEEVNQEIVVFGIVRNPYDRMLSSWKSQREDKHTQKAGHSLLGNATIVNNDLQSHLEKFLETQRKKIKSQGQRYSVLDGHFIPQYDYVFDRPPSELPVGSTTTTTTKTNQKATFVTQNPPFLVLQYETLELDFQCLMKEFQLNISMPSRVNHVFGGTSRLTTADFTPEVRRLIEQIYAQDFDAFGYPKNTRKGKHSRSYTKSTASA